MLALFASAMAARGFIVALVHHRDGSSSRIPGSMNSPPLYYEHPDFENYDINMRKRQRTSLLIPCISLNPCTLYIPAYTLLRTFCTRCVHAFIPCISPVYTPAYTTIYHAPTMYQQGAIVEILGHAWDR